MRKIAAAFCLLCASVAHAGSWFTIMGDAADSALDTVQVDPESVTSGEVKALKVRVNRAVVRTSWDGVPYRSYESLVTVDCDKHEGRYLSIVYYVQPLWKGESHKTSDYSMGAPRMMLFRDITPNPSARIVRAACIAAEPDKK